MLVSRLRLLFRALFSFACHDASPLGSMREK